MEELSVFIDESGSDNLRARYYLLTLVFHRQKDSLEATIRLYEESLKEKGLPNIAFHASPLLNGHEEYSGLSVAERKKFLSAFRVFLRKTPFTYHCVRVDLKKDTLKDDVVNMMKRELVNFFFENLSYFQQFHVTKIYYDNGQSTVAKAIHAAIDYVFSKQAVIYKVTSAQDYRLSQVADYLCTMELTQLKYLDGTSTKTDEKFFGSARQFKKSIYKEMRAKRIDENA